MLLLSALPTLYSKFSAVSFGWTIAMVTLVGGFAIGACILSFLFPMSEPDDRKSTGAKIHGCGSAIGFMMLLFVPLTVAVPAFHYGDKLLGFIAACAFVAGIIFFTLFIMSDKPAFKGTIVGKEGLWQRLCLYTMYLPLLFLSLTEIIG